MADNNPDVKQFLDIDGVVTLLTKIRSRFKSNEDMITALNNFLEENHELKIERFSADEDED